MINENKTQIIDKKFLKKKSSIAIKSDTVAVFEILKSNLDAKLRKNAVTHLLKLLKDGADIDADIIKTLFDAEKDISVATELKRLLNKLLILQKHSSDATAKYDRKLTAEEEDNLRQEIGRIRNLYDNTQKQKGSFDKKYEVICKIVDGGMGSIFKAIRNEDGRPVAIKFLLLEELAKNNNQERIIARFKREGEILKRLNHKNVVKAYECGEANGEYFLVMEYVAGGTLDDLIMHNPLDWGMAKEMCLELCDAVEYIHENGVIHRDIKPGNILLAMDREGLQQMKLCDFGLSKDKRDGKLSKFSFQAGTDDYSSPQQLEDARSADERDDIYSMGKTFYEMLTGNVIRDNDQYEEITDYNTTVPRGFDEIVEKCIKHRKEERFQNVSELRETIKKYCEEKP